MKSGSHRSEVRPALCANLDELDRKRRCSPIDDGVILALSQRSSASGRERIPSNIDDELKADASSRA